MHRDAEQIEPENLEAWRKWLEANYDRGRGVWLVSLKKRSGRQTFTMEEAIEQALCFGWIDSLPGKVDEERTKLWFAPRKSGSRWSKINKERVQRMIENGQMTAAGQTKIDAAKADGTWAALDAVEALEVPKDLRLALKRQPPAEANFEAFPRSAKRGILEWILAAKQPQTRAKRIEETAALAALNKRANQWRGRTSTKS